MTAVRYRAPDRQRGIALVIGLIMLMLITMLAVSAFRLGAVQTVVVSNAQHRTQGIAAAQAAIDTVVSSSDFTKNPLESIVNSNCTEGGTNVLCVSSNGDSVNDFKVTLTPAPYCVTAAIVKAEDLRIDAVNPAASADFGCLTDQQQQWAIEGVVISGSSRCASSIWEITAKAVDTVTNTTVKVTQGVAQRILAAEMSGSACAVP